MLELSCGESDDVVTIQTKMADFLSTVRQDGQHNRHYQSGPAQILQGLYLGDYSDADSLGLLQELGVTHMLNCACAGYGYDNESDWCPFPPEVGIREYHELGAEDNVRYNICRHFDEAFEFIDSAIRSTSGTVLVYCAKGMNRSPAICIGYLMHDQKMDVLSATKTVANARGKILTNTQFQKQLVHFAKHNNLLSC